MRYLGGKCRIAKEVAAAIRTRTDSPLIYEPFMGGGNVTVELAQQFAWVVASDFHEDLILMWQAAQRGWEPPLTCTKVKYDELRKDRPSALRGLVGFGMSFGGKWFGGFVGEDTRRARVAAPGAAIRKQVKHFSNVTIAWRSYLDFVPEPGTAVYLDPPYANTTGYLGGFDNKLFWATAARWRSYGVAVFVSEYAAPQGWTPIWAKNIARNMKSDFTTTSTVRETVFA